MKFRIISAVVIAAVSLIGGFMFYSSQVSNPAVVSEVTTMPDGARAARVAVLTLPSGRVLPANYLHEDNQVFIGVDGLWWREFKEPSPVEILIKGQHHKGSGQVILNEPEYTADVFSRLRPTVPSWLPDFMNGKLVVITLGNNRSEQNHD